MPTIVYKCEKCGETFEKYYLLYSKVPDEKDVVCPKCNIGTSSHKILTGFNFRFKDKDEAK